MTPWRAASRAYYAHHAHCTTCIGAGQQPGVQTRCEEGAQLWRAYQDQPLPHVLAGPVRHGGGVLGAKSGAKSVTKTQQGKNFR